MVPDETLMAYADGALEPKEQEQIERLLAGAPALRIRLGVFEATGAPLAHLFDPVLEAPVPDHLVRLVRESAAQYACQNVPQYMRPQYMRPQYMQKGLVDSRRGAEPVDGLLSRMLALLVPQTVPGVAVAATFVLALGAGAGWWVGTGTVGEGDTMRSVVELEGGALVARGHLALALETVKSGTSLVWASGEGQRLSIRPKLTFRDDKGRYCREYELIMAGKGQFSGLACRTDLGRSPWRLLVHAELPNAPRKGPGGGAGAITPAGEEDNPVLGAAIDRLRVGDPLGASAEEQVIAEGWPAEVAPVEGQ